MRYLDGITADQFMETMRINTLSCVLRLAGSLSGAAVAEMAETRPELDASWRCNTHQRLWLLLTPKRVRLQVEASS
jgi:hypothetical protein